MAVDKKTLANDQVTTTAGAYRKPIREGATEAQAPAHQVPAHDGPTEVGVETSERALQRLLAPVSVQSFFADVWEQNYLHVRRSASAPGYFADLISLDVIDELLNGAYGGIRQADSLQMGRGGFVVPPQEYLINQYGSFAEPDIDKVYRLFRAGATIILTRLHVTYPPVAALCRQLSQLFGVAIQVTAYLTPANSQGFGYHFDTHDVLLLQVGGEKQWQLFGSPVHLATPAIAQERGQKNPACQPIAFTVGAGDTLYLPRGMLHEALTSQELSLHLTIGIHPYTFADLATDIVTEVIADRVQNDVAFRRSVTPRLNGEVIARLDLKAHFAQLIGTILDDRLIRGALRRRLSRHQQEARPLLRGQLHQLLASGSIDLDSVVQLRPTAVFESIHSGDRIILSFHRKQVEFPSYVGRHLQCLLSGNRTVIRDLSADLDDPGKLVLVARLIDEGLVELLPAGVGCQEPGRQGV